MSPATSGRLPGSPAAYLQAGDIARAKEILKAAPADKAAAPEIAAARAAVEVAEQGAGAVAAIDGLAERLARDPADHQARLELAMAYFGAGRREQAIDELIEVIRRDREWNEQAARRQLLKLFEAMGPTDP